MTPGTILANRFMARCGQLWPDTVRLELTGVGDAVPIAYVHQAVECIRAGNPMAAIPILRKRVSYGVNGKTDLTGFLLRDIGGEKVPHTLAVEIKATKGEKIGDDQVDYHEIMRAFNVILIVVRDLDQGISDLSKYAGPGEKK